MGGTDDPLKVARECRLLYEGALLPSVLDKFCDSSDPLPAVGQGDGDKGTLQSAKTDSAVSCEWNVTRLASSLRAWACRAEEKPGKGGLPVISGLKLSKGDWHGAVWRRAPIGESSGGDWQCRLLENSLRAPAGSGCFHSSPKAGLQISVWWEADFEGRNVRPPVG